MNESPYILLYVDRPEASAAFYQALLDRTPLESSPTFALFALSDGAKLGLWSRHTVEPAASAAGGGGELAFPVAGDAELERRHAEWLARGWPVAQAPTRMDFGYTWVGLDPDGHRLRFFSPAA